MLTNIVGMTSTTIRWTTCTAAGLVLRSTSYDCGGAWSWGVYVSSRTRNLGLTQSPGALFDVSGWASDADDGVRRAMRAAVVIEATISEAA